LYLTGTYSFDPAQTISFTVSRKDQYMLDHPILSAKPRALLCASLTILLASCGGGNGPDAAKNGQALTDQFAASIVTAATNLALNRPATASSVESSAMSAGAAVDGNSGSRWSSLESDAQWIRVDLGAATTINHVSLAWEAAYAKAYQIQVSTDGVTWSTVYSTTAGAGGTEERDFAAVSARYVRINCTQRGTPWGYSLFELKVSNEAPVVAPTNFAKGKLALASSIEAADVPAAAAFDGSLSSRWSSSYGDANWLRVDLGAATTIDQLDHGVQHHGRHRRHLGHPLQCSQRALPADEWPATGHAMGLLAVRDVGLF
jgi:hypothetical protein